VSTVVTGRALTYGGALSHDGRWLAYQSEESTRPDVFVRDLSGTGGRWQISTTGGEEPHWSADDREIFYRNDTRLMAAAVVTKPHVQVEPARRAFDGVYNLRSDTGMTTNVDPGVDAS